MLRMRIVVAVSSLFIFGLFTQCNTMEDYSQESQLEFGAGRSPDGGGSITGGGTVSVAGQQRIQNAFQNTVWTTLRTSDGNFSCTGCHSRGGLGGRIPHSDSDIQVAMEAMEDFQLVDRNNPGNSRIVTTIRTGHNGSGGALAAATLTNMVGEWVAEIEAVEAEEGTVNSGGGSTPPAPQKAPTCEPDLVTEEFQFGQNTGGTGLTRRGSFDQNVFPVMQMTGCANCHTTASGARIAHSSNVAGTAYNVWENNNLANFNDPTNSDILLKFVNGHQGFNGASDEYNDIRNAIIAWRDNIDPNAGMAAGNATLEERIYDVCDSYTDPVPSMNSIADDDNAKMEQVSGGSFTPAMATLSGGFTYTNNEYIGNPNAHAIFNVNNNNGGRIVFEFDVYEPGTYEVIAEVWSTDGSTDSFFVAIGDTPTPTEALNGMDYVAWRFGDTNEQYVAMEAQDSDAGAKKTWDLGVGKHYLVFKERENFSRLRNVVVKLEGANDPVTVNSYKELEFDLSMALNTPGAKLTMRVEDYDDKSYKISDVRIKDAQYAYVKNLKILINGNYYSGNATYTLVDERVTSNDHLLSSAAMILLKERGAGDWPEIDPNMMTEYLLALADPNTTDYSKFWLMENGEIVYQPADVLSLEFQTLVMTQPKN